MKKKPEMPTEPAFQIAWVLLHLAGAAMNIGSAVYHLRRIRPTKKEESEDPSLYASYWTKS